MVICTNLKPVSCRHWSTTLAKKATTPPKGLNLTMKLWKIALFAQIWLKKPPENLCQCFITYNFDLEAWNWGDSGYDRDSNPGSFDPEPNVLHSTTD
jgi:hypothetical protein